MSNYFFQKAHVALFNKMCLIITFLFFSDRWKRRLDRTRSASLIKSALHFPKCLKSKSGTNPSTNIVSGGQAQHHQQGVCKTIKRSINSALPSKSSFRSKSDNCLHRIHCSNNNQYTNPKVHSGLNLTPDEESYPNKKSFGKRVANAFAQFVLLSGHGSTHQSYNEGYNSSPDDDRCLTKLNLKREQLVKSTSLERNINFRITEAEEQARRTKSLERNHRHLVTIDSTCR